MVQYTNNKIYNDTMILYLIKRFGKFLLNKIHTYVILFHKIQKCINDIEIFFFFFYNEK